jgi:hypothetical protein
MSAGRPSSSGGTVICERCHRDQVLTYRSKALGLRSICAPCIRTFNGWIDNHKQSRWDYFGNGVHRGFVTYETLRRVPTAMLRVAVLRKFPSLPPPLLGEHHEWPPGPR